MRKREEAQRMLEAIGEIREELVEAAVETPRRNRNRHWGGILAAVLALAVVTPALVFPLTAAGEIGSVTAERNITLDFSPYLTREKTAEDGTRYNTEDAAAIITDT